MFTSVIGDDLCFETWVYPRFWVNRNLILL